LPFEQQRTEAFGAEVFAAQGYPDLVDPFFGPFASTVSALRFWRDYDGRGGDQWDALIYPRLQARKAGLRIRSVSVSYQHPEEMTRAEQHNISFTIKRIKQVCSSAVSLRHI